MRVLIFIILIDIFIFALGSIYVEDKPTGDFNKEYPMDRFGYQWVVDE
jgi:hypothetical protein